MHKPLHLTVAELRLMEIAVRLRAEASDENGDDDHDDWRKLHKKIEAAIRRVAG